MLTIKNTQTGETINVSNTIVRDGRIMGRYEFGKRYYNKYTMMSKIGAEGERPILQLSDEWEIVPPKRQPRTDEPIPAPVDATEPAPEVAEETPMTEPAPQPTPTPAPTTPTQSAVVDAFAALTPLFAGVQANVQTAVMSELKPVIDKLQRQVMQQ